MHTKGFTLVELSIVLVIIGLLIGGILVGQNLVDATKRNSLISQVEQYHIAIRLFKDRYLFFPGDLPDAYTKLGTACGSNTTVSNGGTGQNGNGNGRVDWAVTGNIRESRVTMCHITQSSLLSQSEEYTRAGNQSTNQYFIGESVATTAYDDIGLIITGKGFDSDGVTTQNGYKYVIWVGGENIGGGSGPTPLNWALEPDIVFAIDQKYDDGSPQNGSVRPVTRTSPSGCTNGNSYNMSGGQCGIMFFDPLKQ